MSATQLLASWHRDQALQHTRAADHRAADKQEPVRSMLLARAQFHEDAFHHLVRLGQAAAISMPRVVDDRPSSPLSKRIAGLIEAAIRCGREGLSGHEDEVQRIVSEVQALERNGAHNEPR